MEAIMEVLQPIIDTISGLISGEVEISEVITMIQEAISGIIGG